MGVLVKKVDETNYMSSVFQPLHLWVWLCVLGASVFVAFVIKLFLTMLKVLGKGDCVDGRYTSCLWYCIGSLLAQSKCNNLMTTLRMPDHDELQYAVHFVFFHPSNMCHEGCYI